MQAAHGDRRHVMVGLASVAATVLSAKPANAAYGDTANIFGKQTTTSGTFNLLNWM